MRESDPSRIAGRGRAPGDPQSELVFLNSAVHCSLSRLHHRLDDICADLLPHLAAGDCGEAVVEARADTGIGDLIAKSPKIGEVMCDPGEEGARQCHFGDLVATEQGFDNAATDELRMQ